MTITTLSRTDGATILSRTNLSGYVGHVTIFSQMLTIECCSAVGLGSGLCVWLVSCYAHVFVRLWVVIVTDRAAHRSAEFRSCVYSAIPIRASRVRVGPSAESYCNQFRGDKAMRTSRYRRAAALVE